MRITQNMMSRGYIKRMNRNLSNLAGSNNRLSSGQQYTRVSQNTSQTARALTIREELYRNEQYTTTIGAAQSELSAAEGNLQMMNNIMRNLEDRLLQANTGTMPQTEREMIAVELENLQGQVMQIANAQFSGKHLFSGSGTGQAPFSKDANGKLLYNGYDVESITYNKTTGEYMVPDPADPTATIPMNYNKDIYVDIGMGLTLSGSGTGTTLDQRTAVKLSTNGLEAFGFGKDANGMPQNAYSLMSKIIEDIRSGNSAEMDKDLAEIGNTYDRLLMTLTDIGTRVTYLDGSLDRMSTESINLKTTQQQLEAVQLDQESIYNKSHEMSWMVTLQLGSKLIPPSIFDFLR